MSDANFHRVTADGSPSAEDGAEGRRKRVRKGTTSCWECKRRKIRCTLSSSACTEPNAVCDGCRRRGTACIGQTFPDVRTARPATAVEGPGADRLGRVEALVEKLLRTAGTVPNGVSGNLNLNLPGTPLRDEHAIPGRSPPPQSATPRAEHHAPESKQEKASRALVAAWPNPRDLDLILSIPITKSISEIQRIRNADYMPPCTESSYENTSASHPSRDILRLPPPGSHPVLIAQKLLVLAIFLQDIRPSLQLAQSRSQDEVLFGIMSRAVEAASSFLTAEDELVASIEGIECLRLESEYHDNAVNLRRSWVAIRRAMMTAQMIGLHRAARYGVCAKMVDPASRSSINPETLWFRLIQSDRYLSLMIGLPQALSENVFATPKALESCTPLEQMRRLNCVAAGRILQRNDGDDGDEKDLATTHDIDKLLQTTSALMPPRWWLVPPSPGRSKDSESDNNADRDNIRPTSLTSDTMRLMDQLAHFHLLVQLHLPYLLRPSASHKYDYSKITIANASRELLGRFIVFRDMHQLESYCRGVDFLAFIASAALCLTHMESRRHQSPTNNVMDFLLHQRASDRGMMECVLERVEHIAAVTADVITSKISIILRQLLIIEADAADGATYSANSSAGRHDGGEELECDGPLSVGGDVLNIYIPHYGTIKIERSGISKSVPESHAQDSQLLAAAADDMDWTLQGVDMAFFDSLIRGMSEPDLLAAEWPSGV
ncbi:hypothetical protein B0T19DRAFT_360444 [Cercophora scortea]|uniref:Zn(2)-C6 fungal-type domain-containing protein n=1 Tax=Cercophora scortea TaxID=314031 RepID=A0AAE0IAD2_9PEZI|nr:hypothetical protein B0T19DRAFT_360444 [Cercophora scortea]